MSGGGDSYERPAIAGSGVIACGLAACASAAGEVHMLARSDESAWRAEERAQGIAEKLEGGDPDRIEVTTDSADLVGCDLVVESIVEDLQTKVELLASLGVACPEADLATTTSWLRIGELADRSDQPERVFGLHVFNPVPRMELVELCLPGRLRPGVAERAREWCARLGKTPVEVPDQSGFVVNRLLFPFLFDAVHMLESTGMSPEDVDACVTGGAAHPMGPLKLLDLVGLDVAMAIGEALHDETNEQRHAPPQLLRALVSERRVGRKSGAGFYEY